MVVKRKISKLRYFIALIITLLIFIPGLLLGMIMDNERTRSLQLQSEVQEMDFKSLQLNYLYITYLQNDNNSCAALKAALEGSIKDLSKSLDTLENYKKDAKLNERDFELLSRNYLLDNLNYWLLSKKTKELCSYDTVNVLYFFNSECDTCSEQGIILTYFKKKLGDRFLVFPINTDLIEDESMVKILLSTYNVTKYPSVVIEDETYSDVLNLEEVQEVICEVQNLNESQCQQLI